ncbi:MAG: hypothetical protein IPM26_15205 [Saprospiraceae bacterium]|nr:hypothetical protein [Saprospiraceae bacterium]
MNDFIEHIDWTLVAWAGFLIFAAYFLLSLKSLNLGAGDSNGNMSKPLSLSAMWYAYKDTLLSLLLVYIGYFIIIPGYFPLFWSQYYHSGLFTPSTIMLFLSYYMWTVRCRSIYMWVFFAMLLLIFLNFGRLGSLG